MHYLLIKIYFKYLQVGKIKSKITYKIRMINSLTPTLC